MRTWFFVATILLVVCSVDTRAGETATQVGMSLSGSLGRHGVWSLQERINDPGATEREIEIGRRIGNSKLLGVYMSDDTEEEFVGLAYLWQKSVSSWTLSVAAVGYKNLEDGADKVKLLGSMTKLLGARWTAGGVLRTVKKEGSESVLELGGELGYKISVKQPLQVRVQYMYNLNGGDHIYVLASSSF